PQYCGQGYAFESAAAVLEYALKELRLPRVLATTRPYNSSSAKLLTRLGMHYERRIPHPGGEGELMLFSIAAPGNAAWAADQ
ncbi:MAG TPA: GNAT family N-acetyltransferase, partial [Pseudoduganella sp.]